MKKAILGATIAATLLVSTAARADYDGRVVGNWIISAKDDRFGDGGVYTAVALGEGYMFAVRCLNKAFSYAVISIGEKARQGSPYRFKFRVDRGKVYQGAGLPIGERIVQVFAEPGLDADLTSGKELAIRQEVEGVSQTQVIKLRGAGKALADVFEGCPADKRPIAKFDKNGNLTADSVGLD